MSMIYASINHPDNPGGRGYQLNLPEKDSRITDCLRRFELPDVSTEKNCLMQNVYLLGQEFPVLDGRLCNLDELNYLAKRLDSLDPKERQPFLAAAEASGADDVEKLINLTFNTHCYSVACNFTDFDELGRRLYLNEHTTLPTDKKINFNFYALDILAQTPLAATKHGVVYENSNQPEQIYNGRQFPQYRHGSDVAGMLTIRSEAGAEYLDLPCEDIALTKALHRLGEDWLEDCQYSYENESLPKSACVLFENSDDPTGCFTALNKLANTMSRLPTDQYGKFLALCAWAKPDTIAGHVTLCENCEDFQYLPGITDLEKYGKKLLLENWKLPDDAALGYIDFQGFGAHKLAQMPGQLTDYGLLKYVGSAPEIAQIAKLPFQQPEYSTLRLFAPIHCDLYEYGHYGDLESEPHDLSASESADYAESIAEMVEAYNRHEGPRGLAPYLHTGSLADKVYSILPTVEEYGGRLFGVMECQLREPLTGAEYADLCDQCAGQMSDGYGEGLEQQEIKVADGVLNAHLWNDSKDWSIQSESQLKGEPEQSFGMRMQ